MPLAQLQGDFQQYLLRGAAAISGQVRGSAKVPAATRLAIYGDAYRSRLAEALGNNYPVLAQLLGPADFAPLAAAYVREHDSAFFSIRYYGAELPQFLSRHENYLTAPVLAELAHWEWAMGRTFDAADAPVLDHAALAQLPPQRWGQLRLTFHPSLERLALLWNVPQLWQALNAQQERPELTLAAQPQQWLLWRHGLDTFYRSLSDSEATALDAARNHWSFGELCELLCEALGAEAAPTEAATLLRGWVESGLISAAD
jgi:hypothetical protein